MKVTFADFLAEAKENYPDGHIMWHEKKQCYAGYMGGKLVTTKKNEEAVRAYLTALGAYGGTPTKTSAALKGKTATDKVSSKPKAAKKEVAPSHPDDEPEEEEEIPENIEKEYHIPVHNIPYLQAQIEKLNKTAAKLGCKPIELIMGEVYASEKNKSNKSNKTKEYINIQKVIIKGEAPKLNGWTFVGKREPMEGTASIMAKSAPGMKLPKRYSDDHDVTCEHCKVNRYRSESFVVKKGKKHVEVGRSCLKDFLGHADPSKYANFAEMLGSIDEWMSELSDPDHEARGARIEYTYDTKEMFAAAIHAINEKGFVSGQYADTNKLTTSQALRNHFNPGKCPTGMTSEEWFKMNNIPFTKEDEAAAEKVIEWLKNHPKAAREEFHINLAKIAATPAVSLKMTGYVAAGANGYLKEQGLIKKTDGIMKTMKKDEGLGEVGQKVDVQGVVISLFRYQNDWGTKNIVTVKTESGHLVKMFTMSGDSDMKKDSKVRITGKIGSVEPETYDRSPFKGFMTTTMAPRSRIETVWDAETTDKHYHVGDKIKFMGDDGKGKVGKIVAKPTFGKFEVQSITQHNAPTIHVAYDKIIGLM